MRLAPPGGSPGGACGARYTAGMPGGTSIATRRVHSPLGELLVSASERGVRVVRFPPCIDSVSEAGSAGAARCLDVLVGELHDYFQGRLQSFSVPMDLEGTEFQRRVWDALRQIGFGRTATYADLARSAGSETAFRAVGAANGANRLPILIPCHRVIASDGTLGGYSGELWRKRWLLEHERRVAGLPPLDLFEFKLPTSEAASG